MVSSYFVGYSECSRDYKFYAPTLKTIFQMGTTQLFENVKFRGEIRLETLPLRKNQSQFLNRFL